MKATYKVTDETIFGQTIEEVDTSLLVCTDTPSFKATGNLGIRLKNGAWKEIDGEHGAKDYAEEYGFILEPTI